MVYSNVHEDYYLRVCWQHRKKRATNNLIEMATTVPPSRVDNYVAIPTHCEVKNTHPHCLDETTTAACNLDSGLGVMGYNSKKESDATMSTMLSGDAKRRSQSQLTAIQSHRVSPPHPPPYA